MNPCPPAGAPPVSGAIVYCSVLGPFTLLRKIIKPNLCCEHCHYGPHDKGRKTERLSHSPKATQLVCMRLKPHSLSPQHPGSCLLHGTVSHSVTPAETLGWLDPSCFPEAPSHAPLRSSPGGNIPNSFLVGKVEGTPQNLSRGHWLFQEGCRGVRLKDVTESGRDETLKCLVGREEDEVNKTHHRWILS